MSRAITRRLTNWLRHVRQHGLRAALRLLIERFVYRSFRCLVTYSSVVGPPVPNQIGGISFRVATPSDLGRLEEFERYGRVATTRQYVGDDKDWLFLACDGDRIVATRRATLIIRDKVLSRVITLEPGQFWGADLFCLPEYRNQNIGRHLKFFGDRYLASLGYKDFLSSIAVTNIPSIRASRAAGRRALYYVSFVRILFWERVRVSPEIPRRFWDDLK